MILTEKFNFLQAFLKELYKTHVWIYEADWNLIYTNCPHINEFKNFFLLSINKCDSSILSDESYNSIYYFDTLNLSWMIIPDRTSDQLLYYVVGPVFSSAISDSVLKNTLKVSEMSISSQIKFSKTLESTPVIPLATFYKLSDIVYFSIYNCVPNRKGTLTTSDNNNDNEQKFSTSDPIARRNSYLWEQKMMNIVRTGDLTATLQDYDIFYEAGYLSSDNPLRQAKDMLIVFTTLTTRAAIEGGLLPHIAYDLSDFYIQKIEACNNQSEITQIGASMHSDFVNKVHATLHERTYSLAVRNAITLLRKNITSNNCIEDIAKELGYSTYYLTSQIKKETGKTYKEIVKDEKIFQAKLLLQSTNKTISDISTELNYISPSYFVNVFKKETGLTPKEWRKKPQTTKSK